MIVTIYYDEDDGDEEEDSGGRVYIVMMMIIVDRATLYEQGNYSLRRPPKLVIPQAVIGKDGLLYIQTCTSKQSYTARVRVDCAV